MVVFTLVKSFFEKIAGNGVQQARNGQPQQEQQQQQGGPSFVQRMLQMFLWYYMISFAMKSFTGQNNKQQNNSNILQNKNSNKLDSNPNVITSTNHHLNYWKPDTPYNIRFVIFYFYFLFNLLLES